MTTVTLRSALKRNGRMPRHLLSGLISCAKCGGSYAIVNAREFGCTTHKAGGGCDNNVRVKIDIAERHLLDVIREEILSPEGIAAAEALRERVALPNLGLRDPRSILQGRNALFGMFGGKLPLRPVLDTERPYLVARVGINRTALLDSCRLTGSGACFLAVSNRPIPLVAP